MSPTSSAFTTLNVYSLLLHPLRSTAEDYLYSFRRYGSGRQLYLNLAVREVPDWAREVPIDLVVFQTTFFSERWIPEVFARIAERAEPLRGVGRVRVALPQDEYTGGEQLNEFLKDYEIDHVFSLAPPSEWPKIYPRLDRKRVAISRSLPGYLADDTAKRIERIVDRTRERPVEIGYRAWSGAPWLGRHGVLKGQVGEVFREAAPRHGVSTDISSRDSDVLLGDDWFRFLASCKYTLGCEGGASMLDWDGSIRERTDRYQAEHPDAGFDEVEAACFPGQDGTLDYFAIGPRHIEACATRTCQVLVEGDYQGILRPWEHYIPVKRDFSNLDEVLELIRRDELREEITENAYRDVIASERYTYRSFVREVEAAATESAPETPRQARSMAMLERRERLMDSLSWGRVLFKIRIEPRWDLFKARRTLRRQRRVMFRRRMTLAAYRAMTRVLPKRARSALGRLVAKRRERRVP